MPNATYSNTYPLLPLVVIYLLLALGIFFVASYSSLEFKVIGTLVIVSSFSLATYFTKFSHIKPASLGIVFTVLTVTACAGVYFLIEVLFSGVEFFIKLIVVFLTESLAAKSLLKWSGKNE